MRLPGNHPSISPEGVIPVALLTAGVEAETRELGHDCRPKHVNGVYG